MKLTCFILISVVGICTAKSLHRTEWKDFVSEESSPNDLKNMRMDKEVQNGRLIRESKIKVNIPEIVEDAKNKLSQVKDSVSKKFSDIWNKLTGYDEQSKGEEEVPIDKSNLPTFPDPFEITQLYETYTLGDVNFTNIELRGLSTFAEGKLRINREKKTAVLHLMSKEMQIKGKYEIISKVKNTKGGFQVNIYNNVTHEEKITYEAENGNFRIVSSESEFEVGKMDTAYENIGFFTQILEGDINDKLMADVEKKVGEVVVNKMRPIIVNEIEESKISNEKRCQLTEAVKEAVNDAQQQMAQYGDFRVELKDDQSEEMKDGDFKASISTMYLNGLEKFKLKAVTIEKKDHKIKTQLILIVDEASGSALMSVRHQYKPTEPFQKINVGFKVTGLKTEITITKNMNGSVGNDASPPEVSGISVDVDDVTIEMRDYYEGAVRNIIRDQMPEVLKRSLSKILSRRMYDDVIAYMFKGVLPPTNFNPQYYE